MCAARVDHIAFLTPGNYSDDEPEAGFERTLELFRVGESLGYDSAWVRQRHLERAVSSAATFLAAASQRTTRIGLGSAVIQMGYENPFRLAEDLATVDVLSKGRLNVGLSAGAPNHGALLGERLFDSDPDLVDFSHERIARLRRNLAGDWLGHEDTFVESAAGRVRPRVSPYAPGLNDRLWYGGGSRRSIEWAGRNGFNLLISNITLGEGTDDYREAQLRQLDLFHSSWNEARAPRVALGRVIVPVDGADIRTRQRYQSFAEGRYARTLMPHGERRILFVPDLVGTADEIVERLLTDPVVEGVRELRLELPYDLPFENYHQILEDFITRIAPHLGWRPPAEREPVAA
ncbi:luciferase-like monooxygenase family protein [Paraburkholderia xenovorans LB400]|uniref:Luciferase-like monooxygenase n=1 Tax=Paraburkholderia xenovorans (strain LB400) TaxID=266265 RepID=Q13HY4_PARXL|nr:LLM class flavin-dependent oxidoreductase [Paraburkholderia xenovorans]ABE36305.1 Putative luciferase-like monooxygenase [Paraburkholderia xenovorans LB400]AIP34549.1 luciferase-like monooxygenase family protein [Paraburkholderia xenovorans LB400]